MLKINIETENKFLYHCVVSYCVDERDGIPPHSIGILVFLQISCGTHMSEQRNCCENKRQQQQQQQQPPKRQCTNIELEELNYILFAFYLRFESQATKRTPRHILCISIYTNHRHHNFKLLQFSTW